MVWAYYLDGLGPQAHDKLAEALDAPWAPVRKLHGASPTQVRGARAMMDLAGGPAPLRDRPREDADP